MIPIAKLTSHFSGVVDLNTLFSIIHYSFSFVGVLLRKIRRNSPNKPQRPQIVKLTVERKKYGSLKYKYNGVEDWWVHNH